MDDAREVLRAVGVEQNHGEGLLSAVQLIALHLRQILAAYTDYYNSFQTHLSLDKDSPGHRPIQRPRSARRAADPRRTTSPILPDIDFGRHRASTSTAI